MCSRIFNEAKLARWERRNANYERIKELQFKVHVTVHENEQDDEGEKTILWVPVHALMSIEGMDYETLTDMIDDYTTEAEEARTEALSGFEPTGSVGSP